MDPSLLAFNGINGADGTYLVPPMTVEYLGRIAYLQQWPARRLADLKHRYHFQAETFALRPELDAQDLSKAGWGVIFPADADPAHVAAIREALSELLQHRKEQAGDLYKEFYRGPDGYRQDESKDDFLRRNGAGPGPVDPRYVPFYLLIVGDPQSIPFLFQYELDVQYAVGRIYFEDLDQYAHYARSVVDAETPGKVSLPRKAVFFGVENEDDPATARSAADLARPLAEYVAGSEDDLGWQAELIPADDTTKERLGQFLGGDDTPAFLFTASHGMGFPHGHKYQRDFQGALLCRDWPGPIRSRPGGIPRGCYLGAEDIASDARLLGLISFHFACFGAGTPYQDSFSGRAYGTRSALAPYGFLAALPQRLLGHPGGGALAAIGHIDRAWSYSFDWKDAPSSRTAFESVLYRLLSGDTVGAALDDMNLRYAEFATMLSSEQEERGDPDLGKMAALWTAHNDARSYAVVGDPAVRVPFAPRGTEPTAHPTLEELPGREGELPPVLVASALPEGPAAEEPPSPPRPTATYEVQAQTALDGYAALMARYGDLEAESYGLGADQIKKVLGALSDALQSVTTRLAELAADVSGLEVGTYVARDVNAVEFKGGRFSAGATQRALTHVSLDGDTQVCVPLDAAKLDETLWAIHNDMVQQAMANRTAMITAIADALTSLLGAPKAG